MTTQNRKKPYVDSNGENSNSSFPSLSQVSEATATSSPIWRPSYAPCIPELEFNSLAEMFNKSVSLHAERPCLGHRPIDSAGNAGDYSFMTYGEAGKKVDVISAAWVSLGVRQGDKVGIIGPNSPQWMLSMQACNALGSVCVPLYDSLGEDAVEHILSHSECRLVCSSSSKLPTLIKGLKKARETNKEIAVCGLICWKESACADGPEIDLLSSDLGIDAFAWDELMVMGKGKPKSIPPKIDPDDLCTIMYTSGTTGQPKGVMISHRAVLSSVAGIKSILDHYKDSFGESFSSNDCYFSYLPLAHIFDRVVEELFIFLGGRIAYYQGDVKKVLDDVGAAKPTLFAGVPRVFERIYAGFMEKVKAGGWLKRLAFRFFYERKKKRMEQGYLFSAAAPLADRFVFSQVKSKLGGKVRVIVSGGAPLASHIEEFVKVAMCAPALQGYGLSETCASSFIANPFLMSHIGTVGAPLAHTELMLESVPEMNYDATDAKEPRGEICIRGPGLFSGYYKDKKLTEEAMTTDGFFRTGDIGALVADGSLKIIDRKKNIFKLSQGEYIAVEKLESVYKKCQSIEQIWIYGTSFESSVIAVVIPSTASAMSWASEHKIEVTQGLKDVITNADFKAHLLSLIRAIGKAEKLKGFELPTAIHLDEELWSVENDLQTPTFKLKRPQLQKKYQNEIDAMYKKMS